MAVDVTVRGAGVFGLAIAYECARRGARVRVIEPVAVAAGASGGPVGALAPHVPEGWNAKKAFQLDSLLLSAEFWGGLAAVSGLPTGYGRLGRLQPVADAAALALARRRAASALDFWQGEAEWRLVQARGGWEPASPSGWLIHDDLSARLHPGLACSALVAAIGALGGEVIVGPADVPAAGPVIWTTGVAGLAALSADLGYPVGVAEKGQAVLLRHDARQAPQLLVDGLHVVPHADGTVAVGSTSERGFDSVGPDDKLDALLSRAVAAMPMLAGAPVLARWAGLRPRTVSRSPILGEWPGRPGWFVANGGFKIGFGLAPKVAQVMAELVLEGRDGIPDGFRVEDCLSPTPGSGGS